MEQSKEVDKNKNSLKNFSDLIKNTWRITLIIWQEMPLLFFGIVLLTIIIGAIPVFAAQAMGTLIDQIFLAQKTGNINVVLPALFLFALLTVIPTVIRSIRGLIDRHFYLRMQDHLELIALKKRGSFDIAQYEDTTFQDRLQRAFNNGIYPVINLLDTQINNLEAIVGIIFGSVAAASINPKVFLLVVLTSIPSFIIEIKYGGRLWSIFAKNSPDQRRYQDLRRFFYNKYSVIDSKLYQAGGKFLVDIKNILTKFRSEQLGTEGWRTTMQIGAGILSVGGLFFGTYLIIQDSIAGIIAIGTVVFAFQTLNRVSGWTSNMLAYTARLLERNLYVTDIFAIFDEKPILKIAKNPVKFELTEAPTVRFENVSFKYPSQEKWALKNINLEIKSGEKLGLVGNNGSGKSTLVRLLLRIHDPVEGKVTVNGIDLRDIKIEDWWKYMGILLQDYTTYNFTVRESIAVGENTEKINDTKVENSAEKSTSLKFISELENKFNHMIGVEFGGIEPSKGQRQKLAIARALYKNKNFLVLDEPTASIDAESASYIFREIEKLPQDISAILISHNFATIKKAGTIVVLEDGCIIEQGTHEELVDLNGKYAEAYSKQKQEFE